MDTVKRIFDMVDLKYSEQQDFADELGVARSVISAWRRGKSKSYMHRLNEIADVLGTTPEYLLSGVSGVETQPAPATADLSPRAAALVDALNRLNEDGQKKLLDYATDLVATGRYIKASTSNLGSKGA